MTIIAGFKCSDGIVLCSDTQETVGNYSKRNVPKLRFEELSGAEKVLAGRPELAIAVSGAGHGPFIDKLADEAWKAARVVDNLEDGCSAIEQAIKNTYEEFGRIYQTGTCPEVELIYAIKVVDGSRLFSASGPIVNEKSGYCAAGVGVHMADFLANRMYKDTLDIRQAIILAAYILFHTKEHVDGCGGDTHIAVLRNTQTSGRLDRIRIEALNKLAETFDPQIGEILLRCCDVRISKNEFTKQCSEILVELSETRQREMDSLKQWSDFWSQMFSSLHLDDLGLPNPDSDASQM